MRTGIGGEPLLLGEPVRLLDEAGSASTCPGIRYGETNVSRAAEPDEDRRPRDPPPVPERPGQAHHDQEREADEQELARRARTSSGRASRRSRAPRRRGGAATRGPSSPNGTWTSQTMARPSIPSSIPVPMRPAADSRAQRHAVARVEGEDGDAGRAAEAT